MPPLAGGGLTRLPHWQSQHSPSTKADKHGTVKPVPTVAEHHLRLTQQPRLSNRFSSLVFASIFRGVCTSQIFSALTAAWSMPYTLRARTDFASFRKDSLKNPQVELLGGKA